MLEWMDGRQASHGESVSNLSPGTSTPGWYLPAQPPVNMQSLTIYPETQPLRVALSGLTATAFPFPAGPITWSIDLQGKCNPLLEHSYIVMWEWLDLPTGRKACGTFQIWRCLQSKSLLHVCFIFIKRFYDLVTFKSNFVGEYLKLQICG